MNKDVEWTEPLMLRLRELHDEGLSFAKIAARMSSEFGFKLTANACVGRAHRAGGFPMRTKHQTRMRKPTPPRGTRPKTGKMVTIQPKLPKLPPAPLDMALGPPGALNISQLTKCTCHWPSGHTMPYTYCGKPTVADSPYCQEHFARMHASR